MPVPLGTCQLVLVELRPLAKSSDAWVVMTMIYDAYTISHPLMKIVIEALEYQV